MQQAARYIGTTFVVYFTLGIAATFLDILAANEDVRYMYAHEWLPALWRTLKLSSYVGVALSAWMSALAFHHAIRLMPEYPSLWPRLKEPLLLLKNPWSMLTVFAGSVVVIAIVMFSLEHYEWATRNPIMRWTYARKPFPTAIAWSIVLLWGVFWLADIVRGSESRRWLGWVWYLTAFVIVALLYTWLVVFAPHREY